MEVVAVRDVEIGADCDAEIAARTIVNGTQELCFAITAAPVLCNADLRPVL